MIPRSTTALGLPLLLLPSLLLGAGLARGADTPKPDATSAADAVTFDKQIKPLLQQYCNGCHGAKSPAAGVNLAAFTDVASVQRDQVTWRKALVQVRGQWVELRPEDLEATLRAWESRSEGELATLGQVLHAQAEAAAADVSFV